MQKATFVLVTLLILPGLALAEDSPAGFGFPVDCRLEEDCWIVNYVDTDPETDEVSDYSCAGKTTDNHQGVDFALRSRFEMDKGVDVRAAKSGVVLRLRDGESDAPKTEAEYRAIRGANKDCGNGVLIEHGDGLQSFYCHLKQGSIKVAQGDAIKEGQKIAQVGQSGYAEFPHLHFAVLKDSAYLDPFTGLPIKEGCDAADEKPMWKDDLAYNPYTVFDGGFAPGKPDFEKIKAGMENPETLPASSEALVYWAGFYHGRRGDTLHMKITGPDGSVFKERHVTIEKSRKRPSFYYTGRKITDIPLKSGIYTGTLTYERAGFPPKTYTHKITIE